jgi:YcaO-like protein with predicted kinase domain
MDNSVINAEREIQRATLASALWLVPYSKLLRYGISSYREVTNLDRVGISVWLSQRPLARTISVNAGKSENWLMAFAGCITEAVEFWAAENPWGKSVTASHHELEQAKQAEILPFREYPLARSSLCDEHMQVEWEEVNKIGATGTAWMPSDCVWIEQRMPTQLVNFQASSNGVASGVTTEDAVLSALYELVERDGWTLHQCLLVETGNWPRKIPLVGLPDELDRIVKMARNAGLSPFLFDVSTDLGIPVFGCTLFDGNLTSQGTFGGYGSSLSPLMAARRALLESFQSRVCYMSGARDDLYRREFLLLKQADQSKTIDLSEKLRPCAPDWNQFASVYGSPTFESIGEELAALISRLASKGITRLYTRTLAEETLGDCKLVVVRVIAPQLEGIKFGEWQSNGRAEAYVRKHLNSAAA